MEVCFAVFDSVSLRNCKRCATYSEHLHRDLSPQGGCLQQEAWLQEKGKLQESFLFIEFQQPRAAGFLCSSDTSNLSRKCNPYP